jgi:hypothetical protein
MKAIMDIRVSRPSWTSVSSQTSLSLQTLPISLCGVVSEKSDPE